MAKIEIRTYYDIICTDCRKSFVESNGGLPYTDKGALQKDAYRDGWASRVGMTFCPECLHERFGKHDPAKRLRMAHKCSIKNPKWKRRAKKTRETMADGTERLYCYGLTDPMYDEPLPECAACPNHISHVSDDFEASKALRKEEN